MDGRGFPRRARRESRLTLLQALVALLLAASLATPVLAQSPAAPSPSPSPSMASSEEPGRGSSRFPTIAGQVPEVLTFSGPEWIARSETGSAEGSAFIEETVALVASVGASIDDLTVRTALVEPTPGDRSAVMAVTIAGARAHEFAGDAVGLMLGDLTSPQVVLRQVADRWVLRVLDAAIPGVYPRTMYLHEDTAWLIEADEGVVIDVLGQLPPQAPGEVETEPSETLVARLPLAIGGERRDGLYELLDWSQLPSAQAVFEGELEEALARLYLDEGITPADVIAAIAWWGEGEAEDAVQIEGYRLPGAGPAVLDRFLSQVLLPGITGSEAAAEPRSERIGDRDVTVIDLAQEFGPETRYLFASGDIAWVVTDFTAAQTLAPEVIASLP